MGEYSEKAAGKIPVLEEPNPMCAPAVVNMPAYKGPMAKLAAQRGVLLIKQYDYILSLPNWQSMLFDCIHPTAAMYAIKAQREADQISALVKSLK
ncbi:hypothetical protein EOS_02475 [Caballeronia mineralivorans PML1(12)]|uniref:SGNH hydrolase-type esterase domain-containing protein n=1 Tax=Caballeronia mineralivorans PML1(12) TaxID=908627 RepID=A0A0J1D536_9BURK|nr:hypothetical protein [Caballeronia mineralivorans]KLU27800.1 hypothetical protein EOS_02475 [Caballeronia mineralivorans PML1(12)]